ncbi:hypothetical protein FA13DRAFT_1782694 [Coprinellus micaceus]|uniref:DNA mismatch repair protein S5 domain-containing protein n=1 Tax=Coprinellus micaceus TaxID=71717 RepID=A0A4Y7RYY9_COPMI|nr:hypothetical protein FA13DRAFT_1782694 [Coprinellus micaceus]
MDVDEEDQDMDEKGSWRSEVYFTNANYQAKKTNFLLFINHRLVESSRMKRAVEAVYTSILPKGASPFVYLSLEVDPKHVDVNVHPTKKEVHFLNEDGITAEICSAVQATLAKQATSRSFETQTLLTRHLTIPSKVASPNGRRVPARRGKGELSTLTRTRIGTTTTGEEQEVDTQLPSTSKPKVYAHYKVRTNLKDRTLDSMFPVANPSQLTGTQAEQSRSKLRPSSQMVPAQLAEESTTSSDTPNVKVRQSEVFLVSIKNLRQEVENARHNQLTEIFEKHSFVGIVDLEKCLSLIQFSTNLYLVNHASVGVLYQLALRQFGDMSRLKLEPPPPVQALVEIAVDAEDTSSSPLSKAEIAEKITSRLISRRAMLAEYFSFDISEDGHVLSLPLLLKDYIPNLDNFAQFPDEVNWNSEAECFETFLRELAYFYAPLSLTGSFSGHEKDNDPTREKAEVSERWANPTRRIPRRCVASLPELYKVFERC